MATQDSIFIIPSGDPTNLTVNAGSATAAQAAGANALIGIIATGDFHISFGAAAMGAPSATSLRMPADSFCRFDLGKSTHFRIFNPGGSAITVQWVRLSKV